MPQESGIPTGQADPDSTSPATLRDRARRIRPRPKPLAKTMLTSGVSLPPHTVNNASMPPKRDRSNPFFFKTHGENSTPYLIHFYYFPYLYRHQLFAVATDFLSADDTGNRRKVPSERRQTEGTSGLKTFCHRNKHACPLMQTDSNCGRSRWGLPPIRRESAQRGCRGRRSTGNADPGI